MVDIKERLLVLLPGITFGADLTELGCDCVIVGNEISAWGRTEPQPTFEELEAVSRADIDGIELQEKREGMVVSAWQFKKALTRSGAKRGQVNAFVSSPNTGDPLVDQDIKDGWASAGEYERLNGTVRYIQSRLDWTDLEVDDLFTLADTL